METNMAEALADVEAARQVTAEWEAELATAEAEVVAAAEERPRTPQDSGGIAQRRLSARERVQVAADALDSARGAETGARRAAVTAEADSLDGAIAGARQALDEYVRQVDALLAPLVELTGSDWAPVVIVRTLHEGSRREVGRMTRQERALHDEVDRLTRVQDLLLRAAAGEDPNVPTDELPASLQPGGILPSASAVQSERERAEREAEAAEWAAVLAGYQTEVDAACAALAIPRREVLSTSSAFAWASGNLGSWHDRMLAEHGRAIPTELETLARLCGPVQAEEAAAEWVAGEKVRA